MQEFAWQGFQLALPGDWECVRFGKDPAQGECVLADRAGPQLSFAWNVMKSGADVEKMIQKLELQLRRADSKKEANSADWKSPSPWQGFLWEGSESLAVAVAQIPGTQFLVKMQFTRRKADGLELEDQILRSVRRQAADAPWRWQAFGCRFTLPSDFEMQRCEVLAGKVGMIFRAPGRNGSLFKLQRLAMPELCLKGRSLEDWYCKTLPEGAAVGRVQAATVRGHKAADVQAALPPVTAWTRLLRRRSASRGLVWACEKEQRLYTAEWQGAGDSSRALEKVVECQ